MIRTVQIALAAGLLSAFPVFAETPPPFKDFSAKRVGVPKPGTRPKIVQIDPEEQAAALAALARPVTIDPDSLIPEAEPEIKLPEKIGNYSWFWDRISPSMLASGPGRLFDAMEVIAGHGGVQQPRLQQLQEIALENGVDILRNTVGTKVSPALVLAVISVESSGNADAVSPAGAEGLMQLMPATAERFGVSESLAPEQNIKGGVKYLDWLMEEFDNDPIVVLAAYNSGEGSLRKYDGVPPFPETRDYVPKVLAAFQVARALCVTPPELVSDGCVFTGLN